MAIEFGSAESYDVMIADAKKERARLNRLFERSEWGDIDLTDPETWDGRGIDIERDLVFEDLLLFTWYTVVELDRLIRQIDHRISGLICRRDGLLAGVPLRYAGGAGRVTGWVDPALAGQSEGVTR